MNHLIQLIERHPVIALHLGAALTALAVGAVVMARRKGTASHKALGWGFIALMGATALSSIFIRDYRLPNIAGYTPIHLLSVYTAVALPLGVLWIRRGKVASHRRTMKGIFIGGCVVAGLFTLVPGRFLGDLLWKHGLGLIG